MGWCRRSVDLLLAQPIAALVRPFVLAPPLTASLVGKLLVPAPLLAPLLRPVFELSSFVAPPVTLGVRR